jgi:SAM-dependent methyltransferase
MYILVTGRDHVHKPFPKLVEKNLDLLVKVLEPDGHVLDIGAGRGRFLRWFIEKKLPVREYVAVEPYSKFVREHLKPLASKAPFHVTIYEQPWQEVRDLLYMRKWDVIIAWDVAMYLDLRHVWKTSSFKEALIREIAEWIRHCKVLLLSFFPVKTGLPEISGFESGKKNYKVFHEIVTKALETTNGIIYARFHYQNYIIINNP